MGEVLVTRNMAKVQDALNALTPAEQNINELMYYKKCLNEPNHSASLCSSVKKLIKELDEAHTQLVESLMLYGYLYCEKDQQLASGNNSEYDGTGSNCDFTYIAAPEHQKGFWEKTFNQIFLGDFTEDSTWLGSTTSVGAALLGVDAPMDVRDLVANVKNGEWGWAVVSAISLIPVIGAIGKGGKVASKGAKAADTVGDIFDAGTTVLKQDVLTSAILKTDAAKKWGVNADGINQGVIHFCGKWEKEPKRIRKIAEYLGIPDYFFRPSVEGFQNFTEYAEEVVKRAPDEGYVKYINDHKQIYYWANGADPDKGAVVIVYDGKLQSMMNSRLEEFHKME